MVVFSSKLSFPATIAGVACLVWKLSSCITKPQKVSIYLDLGKENRAFEVLGFQFGISTVLVRLPYLGLELIFVLVREIVVRVERKIVLNFGKHWRWLEWGCRAPLPETDGGATSFEKFF